MTQEWSELRLLNQSLYGNKYMQEAEWYYDSYIKGCMLHMQGKNAYYVCLEKAIVCEADPNQIIRGGEYLAR